MPIAVALFVGLLTGVVNGTLIAYLDVPAFIVTLAMLTAARGLAFIVSGGRSRGDLPDHFGLLGRTPDHRHSDAGVGDGGGDARPGRS